MQHRVQPRLILRQVLARRRCFPWNEQIAEMRRLFRVAQLRQFLEVSPRRVIETHRRIPVRELLHRARKMRNRIPPQRPRPMPRRTLCHQLHPGRVLFHRLHRGPPHFAVPPDHAPTLGQTRFRFNLREMIAHQVADPDSGIAFLPRFRHKDHVAIRYRARPLQHHHRHHGGEQIRLVIQRAPAINVAVLVGRAERRQRPFGRVNLHRVAVAHNQQRLLCPVALDAGDQVRPGRFFRDECDRNSLSLQHAFHILRNLCLTRRRGRVNLHQILEVLHAFGVELCPVELLGEGGQRGECEKCEETAHRFTHQISEVFPANTKSSMLISTELLICQIGHPFGRLVLQRRLR